MIFRLFLVSRRRIGGMESSATLIYQLLGKSSRVACAISWRTVWAFEAPNGCMSC
jgi:hypothetical protein